MTKIGPRIYLGVPYVQSLYLNHLKHNVYNSYEIDLKHIFYWKVHPLNVSQIVPQIGFVSIRDCSYVTAYRFVTEIETEQRQLKLFSDPRNKQPFCCLLQERF